MILDYITFSEDEEFSAWAPPLIQDELSYVKSGPVLVTRSKEVNHFPIPVVLKKRGSGETYDNYAEILVERGLAKFGELDLSNPKFSQHARGIDAA